LARNIFSLPKNSEPIISYALTHFTYSSENPSEESHTSRMRNEVSRQEDRALGSDLATSPLDKCRQEEGETGGTVGRSVCRQLSRETGKGQAGPEFGSAVTNSSHI
jgi:hypothetical protein